jgi:hypothetical protein
MRPNRKEPGVSNLKVNSQGEVSGGVSKLPARVLRPLPHPNRVRCASKVENRRLSQASDAGSSHTFAGLAQR